MPLSSVSSRVLGALVLSGVLAAVALPASAHAGLVDSDPADGSTVSELNSVRLEFSEELLEVGNMITVTDGAGAIHELEVTVAEPTVLEAPVGEIAAGEIAIAWRSASVDGHTEEGVLSVTLAAPSPSPSPSPSASPSESTTPAPTLSAVGESPSPSESPVVMPVDSAGASPWLFGILGLVVIGGTAAAIFAATRRPKLYED